MKLAATFSRMRWLVAAAVMVGIVSASGAWAQVPILYYDFENNTTRTTFENLVEQQMNAGSASITRAGNTTTIAGVAGAGTFNAGGAAGQAATATNWSTATTDLGASATDYFQFVVNTSDLAGLSITTDNQASATGPADIGVLYSTNGVTFTSSGLMVNSGNATFSLASFDLSAITAIDNQASVTIRLYAYAGNATDRTGRSAFASGGTFRIDNLTVRAKTITASKTLLDHAAIGLSIKSGTAFNPTYSNLTVSSPATATVSASDVLLAGSGSVVVASGATLATSKTLTNSGTMSVNGTFQIDQGGFGTGNNFVYGAAGTLVFNNTSSSYGVSGTPAYWPAASGPFNVTVQGAGGITMSVARTVSGTFQTAAGALGSNNLVLNGTARINAGGFSPALRPMVGARRSSTTPEASTVAVTNGARRVAPAIPTTSSSATAPS